MYEAIEAKRTQPFIWGTYDCCLFVCDIILAITDVDLAADFRGNYDSQEGANKLSGLANKRTLREFIDRMAENCGVEPIPPEMAGRGDVALFDSELGETLGIFDGHQILRMGYEGVIAVPRSVARCAWGRASY